MPEVGSLENPIQGVSSGGRANQRCPERKAGKIKGDARRNSLLVAGALLTAGALGTGAVVSGKVFDAMGAIGGTADTLVAKPLSDTTTARKEEHNKAAASPEEKQRLEEKIDEESWKAALFEADKLLEGDPARAKNAVRVFVLTTEQQQNEKDRVVVERAESRRRSMVETLIFRMEQKGWDVTKENDIVQKLVALKQEKEAAQLLAIILRTSKQKVALMRGEKDRIWSYYQRNFEEKGVALGEQKYVGGKSLQRQIDSEQQRVREAKARQGLV